MIFLQTMLLLYVLTECLCLLLPDREQELHTMKKLLVLLFIFIFIRGLS